MASKQARPKKKAGKASKASAPVEAPNVACSPGIDGMNMLSASGPTALIAISTA